PARDPGTARPRLAVDDSALHRRGCRAHSRRIRSGTSSREGEPAPPVMTEHAAHHRKVSQIIGELDASSKAHVKLAGLLSVLVGAAFGVLMLILSLPNAVGLGAIPGLSTVFGVPQIFVALQMIIGAHRPWLPNFVLQRSIPMSDFRTMVRKAEPHLQRIERIL